MDFTDMLAGDAVIADLGAANKKTLFQVLGQIAERAFGLTAKDVVERHPRRVRAAREADRLWRDR
jgi:nitrogen PTS system EIIA component